jgi:hypothetical protein
MTPTLKKKVRHSCNVTACMAYLLRCRGNGFSANSMLSGGPVEATNDESVDDYAPFALSMSRDDMPSM